MGVSFSHYTPYRSQSGSKIESQVRRVKAALTSFAISMGQRKTWPLFLPLVTNGLNFQTHFSTKISPFHAMFCFTKNDSTLSILRMSTNYKDPEDPDKVITNRIERGIINDFIMQNDEDSKIKNEAYLNKNAKFRNFPKNSKVMRQIHTHTLAPKVNRSMLGKWIGPYTVVSQLDHLVFLIADFSDDVDKIDVKNDKRIIQEHKQHCKPFNPKTVDLKLPQTAFDDIVKLIPNKQKKHKMVLRSDQSNV